MHSYAALVFVVSQRRKKEVSSPFSTFTVHLCGPVSASREREKKEAENDLSYLFRLLQSHAPLLLLFKRRLFSNICELGNY